MQAERKNKRKYLLFWTWQYLISTYFH